MRLWLPLLVYTLSQFAILLIFKSYVSPVVYPILSPLIALLGKSTETLFSQYPGLYIALPYVYQWAKIIFGVIFEGLVIGLTIMLLLRFAAPRHTDVPTSRSVIGRWPRLLIVWTVVTAVIVAANIILPELFRSYLEGSPRRVAAFDVIMRLAALLLYAVFMYAVPSIIVYKNNIINAFKTTFVIFLRYPIFSFFLALLPYLLTVPTAYLANQSGAIVSKFSPELVFYILTAGLIIDMVVNFILTVAVATFLIEERD
ncbi:MAG: hypothetical protein AB1746_04060 [Candidatus Zixiibacteriota bacterium]